MEFIVEKIGMSRTVTVPAVPVTLVKLVETKVCEVNDGVAIVAYNDGKKFNKAIEGQQKKYDLSKEFNRFATLNVANTEAGDIDTSAMPAFQYIDWIEYSSYNNTTKGFTKQWRDDFNSFDETRWKKGDWTFDGNEVDFIEEKIEIEYSEIPNFPVSTVEGHDGKLVFGKGKKIGLTKEQLRLATVELSKDYIKLGILLLLYRYFAI